MHIEKTFSLDNSNYAHKWEVLIQKKILESAILNCRCVDSKKKAIWKTKQSTKAETHPNGNEQL